MYKDLKAEYDVLIAGAGGAGLGLAYALLTTSSRPPSILIVDPQTKTQNDRTWCFWGPPSTPFSQIAAHSWRYVRVRSEGFSRTFDLGDWRYWMVRGIDYYRFTMHALEQSPLVKFKQARVDRIEEAGDRARVHLEGETVTASWVFDSTLAPQDLAVDAVHYHPIKQHFKGWEIETERDVFSPDTATLFDFRTPQKNDLRFCYVLPFTPRRALVEYTIFSANLLTGPEYEAGLKDYLANGLGISEYHITGEENGVIPMTDQPFRRKASAHVLNIGSKGGLVKPSTGYAFARMQCDALAIAASLERSGQPFSLPQAPARYRLFDSILLQILYRHGDRMKPIFVRMFACNPIRRILRFLDEAAAPWEDTALIVSLPPYPFLRALLKLAITRKV
jgi:lycopene beta-cyclase